MRPIDRGSCGRILSGAESQMLRSTEGTIWPHLTRDTVALDQTRSYWIEMEKEAELKKKVTWKNQNED